MRILEGPPGVTQAGGGPPYWFQQGAFGDASTHTSVGARVMIRTVYDSLNNDAHSYWVGSILSNGAFVQVGYLNGLTTTGQFYCCAWFYEFFPVGNTTSPPIIGSAGSAGPIGSWHTYTMNSTANGVWSFYMDNQYLGSSPSAGSKYNLGSGDTGNNPVAALSEVAQASDRSDSIGPAEFKNLEYTTSRPNSFQTVGTGTVHIGCGLSNACLPNPYGVAEIETTTNIVSDFLAGSNLPNPGPDECGNPTTTTLWSPTLALTCGGSNISFSFVDANGTALTPDWIGLTDSSNGHVFYTHYQNQLVPSPRGQWTITYVSWHSINVTVGETVNTTNPTQVFLTNVFSIRLAVVGYIYSLPVKDSTVILYLPDSTNQTVKTDNNGEALFMQLPPYTYSLHIAVPYGLNSNQVQTITRAGSVIARVFSLPELVTIIIPPILIAVIASVIIVRKEHQRQAMLRAQLPLPPATGPTYCRTCGQALAPTSNFCTSCGTPVKMFAP